MNNDTSLYLVSCPRTEKTINNFYNLSLDSFLNIKLKLISTQSNNFIKIFMSIRIFFKKYEFK